MDSSPNLLISEFDGPLTKFSAFIIMAAEDYGQKGWFLSVSNDDKDIRTPESKYVVLDNKGENANIWTFKKVSNGWRISTLDGNGRKGYLTGINGKSSDNRDSSSIYMFVHQIKDQQGQLFQLMKKNVAGIIQIKIKQISSGYQLTAHRWYDRDKKNDSSTYVHIHAGNKEGQLWFIGVGKED